MNQEDREPSRPPELAEEESFRFTKGVLKFANVAWLAYPIWAMLFAVGPLVIVLVAASVSTLVSLNSLRTHVPRVAVALNALALLPLLYAFWEAVSYAGPRGSVDFIASEKVSSVLGLIVISTNLTVYLVRYRR